MDRISTAHESQDVSGPNMPTPSTAVDATPIPAIRHDRSMAALEGGERLAVEIVNLEPVRTTRESKVMTLEGRLRSNPTDKKVITLWNEPAELFKRTTRFVRPSPKIPLFVEFVGRFRKKDAYHASLDRRTEKWEFNAKSFDIDWLSPAGREPFAASREIAVTGIEQRLSKATKLAFEVVHGITDENRRTSFRFPANASHLLPVLRTATPMRPIVTRFDGQWKMTKDPQKGWLPAFHPSQARITDSQVLSLTLAQQAQPHRSSQLERAL